MLKQQNESKSLQHTVDKRKANAETKEKQILTTYSKQKKSKSLQHTLNKTKANAETKEKQILTTYIKQKKQKKSKTQH
jgi:hypothetical protein